MSEEGSCGCGNSPFALIFACSGSSNVGQLSHSAALKLAQDGVGKMSCLAGIGAHLSGFVVSAKDSEQLVVIDGCDQKCALKVFEHVGIQPHLYLELTEVGFVKQHGVATTDEEVEKACALLADRLKGTTC